MQGTNRKHLAPPGCDIPGPASESTSLSPGCRTIGSTSSCGSSGTTPGWPTTNTRMTLWTWTHPCWIPSGNLTCSLPMRRGPTSTRSPRTTNCCGSPGTGMSSTASGGFRTGSPLPSSECTWPYFLLGADASGEQALATQHLAEQAEPALLLTRPGELLEASGSF